MQASAQEIQILALEQGPALEMIEGEGHAHAVVWPGMGARLRSIHRLELSAGAMTISMRHRSEAVYYVMDGGGEILEIGEDSSQPLRPGSMAHIDANTSYRFAAADRGLSLVGGPCPPDPSLYEGVV